MYVINYSNPSFRLFETVLDDLFEFKNPDVKTPIHDVIENEKEFQVEMLLAGLKKDDVKIDVDDNILKITAERKEVKDLKYNRKETYFGKYEKTFELPEYVDKENISASLVDGILKITVPKIAETKKAKKSIEIT